MNKDEGGRRRRHEKKALCMAKEKAELTEMEESGRETIISQGQAAVRTHAVSTYENIHTEPDSVSSQLSFSESPLSVDKQQLPKPSLSYVALIARVILSSPSQKLNLASIYRAMEEQFPYLRNRGQGWRNSVRHNLSVNDCFVKVSRCEDGRGHYWGVHPTHLRDFQQGNFRQYRKARGRRDRPRYDSAAGCLAWTGTNCHLGGLTGNRPGCLSWVEPQCPLQEPGRYQTGSLDWAEPHYQPWSFNVGWAESACWGRCSYFPDSHDRATVERWPYGRPLTPTLQCWEMHNPTLRGSTELHDSMFMISPRQPFCLPGCWCGTPVFNGLMKPLPYKVSDSFHP